MSPPVISIDLERRGLIDSINSFLCSHSLIHLILQWMLWNPIFYRTWCLPLLGRETKFLPTVAGPNRREEIETVCVCAGNTKGQSKASETWAWAASLKRHGLRRIEQGLPQLPLSSCWYNQHGFSYPGTYSMLCTFLGMTYIHFFQGLYLFSVIAVAWHASFIYGIAISERSCTLI